MISKGFSLIELMVVIAITAIATPMYSNYTIRARIGSELKKLGGAKVNASEYIINNNLALDYTIESLVDMPSGSSIGDDGAIILSTAQIVSGSSISIVPTISSGSIVWSCIGIGLTESQVPSSCRETTTNQASTENQVELVESDKWGSYDCPSGYTCYSYGEDQTIIDGNSQFQARYYQGAGNGDGVYDPETGTFRETYQMYTHPNGLVYANGTYNGEGFSITFNSIGQLENADIDSDVKDEVLNSIELMNQANGFCSTNSTFWACN
ncbi:prepilin-type N-terminal cleavage/methylation domain-containing protein [Francisella sp. 19X1-34]|uniref:pilin n=1 Tax=Francisella sp. 19X1-34 TaxID=3087177 RepID=UPI002E30B37B|nr:prepilin-type N-terminal cleavage/methylation domain-containing protein [Francisella sp. 19X1-34]MED7788228.1 prepilin-type N-terminal cleavage/methylation domain-containing protein [Francisella sp. 19X1-34]